VRRRRSGSDDWARWSPARRGAPLSNTRSRSRFGSTWWGRAWVDALEQRARLDPNRLPRGRSYARSGAVGELVIAAGEARALVQGSRAAPYSVRLRVREFTQAEWNRALAAVAAKSAHAAALLDGELDPAVVEEMAGAGLDLLPAAGELGPTCSCPDWANPCKHAAAVCYLVADSMDADPFTILHLRGRSRDQVLAGLREHRSATAAGAAPAADTRRRSVDAGILARDFFAARPNATAHNTIVPVAQPPTHPGVSAALAADPPDTIAVHAADLRELASDAAHRAWELCNGLGDGGLELSADADIARLAANRIGRSDFDQFARRLGVTPREMMRQALAWRAGGEQALEVLNGPSWLPPRAEMDEGVAVIREVLSRAVSARGDRVTDSRAGAQLRYGRDGLWYLLVRKSGSWEIHHPPAADPRSLVPALAELSQGF